MKTSLDHLPPRKQAELRQVVETVRAAFEEATATRRADRLEVFRQLLPLAPWTGACLLQAELLLRFVNAADLDADWVFGVRTFPFLAHCWLQIGEQCVSEAPETLTVYRPIMVI